ncbi:uncharacterized protein LOC108843137 [Raphanus sativus]|uniref:Uncharacterized protein LOC108843137 n=1 Tax=Raphanus sativus TaxID=3726 RepID=A0A6J0MIL4_RAPSA|nr:uncharacterized protein LOC108843137 [Raphanus sativus]
MCYLNKVWIAASYVAAQGNPDHGVKLKAGLSSAQHLQRRLTSDIRPLSAADVPVDGGRVEEKRLTSSSNPDESLRQVMYLNCWSQG